MNNKNGQNSCLYCCLVNTFIRDKKGRKKQPKELTWKEKKTSQKSWGVDEYLCFLFLAFLFMLLIWLSLYEDNGLLTKKVMLVGEFIKVINSMLLLLWD